MEQKGTVIQLAEQGPNKGSLILIVDFDLKTASLIEVNPTAGDKLRFLSIQDYTKP